MKTTSFYFSEDSHKTYLAKNVFSKKGVEASEFDQNPKTFLSNLIETSTTFKSIADGFYWSDSRVSKNLLIEAWTHKSFLNELGDNVYPSYERWEFLGDSVFGNFITEQLFNKFDKKNEGHLSKLKSQLVSGEMMSKLARTTGLDQLLILGKGEVKRESFRNDALIADIFEATIGVISRQIPRDEVINFLEVLIKHFERVSKTNFYNVDLLLKQEVKGELQELTMRRFKTLPDYQSQEIDKGFEVNLFIDGKLYANQVHQSKKIAQKLCAEKAIKELTQQ